MVPLDRFRLVEGLGMARIPDEVLARLKAEVSVARLVEGCGVRLKSQGKVKHPGVSGDLGQGVGTSAADLLCG